MFVHRRFKQKRALLPGLHKLTASLLLAALFAGLLPPPLVSSAVNATLPDALAQPLTTASQALLPVPKVAQAAAPAPVAHQKLGIEAAPAAPMAKLLTANLTGSNVLTITKTVVGTGSGPFNLTVTGPNGYANNTTIAPGAPLVLTNLVSGIYTVTETSPGTGWTTVYTATPGTGGSTNAVVTLQNSNSATLAKTAISGKVFQDYNSDGLITANGFVTDTGVSSVVITAYDKNGNSVGSATSATNGAYTINPTGAGPYRIVFSQLPSGYEPTAHGSDNGTSTQFVTTVGGASNVNLGINRPIEYAQANPYLAETLYTIGAYNGSNKSQGVVTKWLYNNRGAASSPPYTAPSDIATHQQVGTTYGLAYQRTTGTTFVSAFYKRGAGFGPLGPGGIYAIHASGSVVQYATIPNAGTDNHDFSLATTNVWYDASASGNPLTAQVTGPGRVGLGDLEMAPDGNTLYVVNLNNRNLYSLLANGAPPVTATALGNIAQVNLSATGYNCPASDIRPFGLGFDPKGTLYIGAVCSQESQSNAASTAPWPWVYVLRYNGPSSFTSVFDFALSFNRNSTSQYSRWTDSVVQVNNASIGSITEPVIGSTGVVNQPMAVGVEFDGQDIMIGIRPRGIDQAWTFGKLSAGSAVVRGCWNGSTWVLEANAVCGGVTGAKPGVNIGPGNGLFIDSWSTGDNAYIPYGALVQYPGGDLVINASDPYVIQSAGISRIYNPRSAQAGEVRQRYEVMTGTTARFGKSSGTGDLELLLDPAPLEIGNRVWNDLNGNGIQDPGEPGLSGVTVSLQGPTNTVQTTTNANGLYYFNVSRSTAYTLSITPPSGYNVTTANVAALSGASATSNAAISDTIDSDAVLVGGKAMIYYTTGSAGQNNHGLDFGFVQPVRGKVGITNTAPPTPTPTNTPTDTPTNTPTNTPTAIPTDTPTNTPTATPTDTPTNTPLPTDTPTAIPTDTPTNTPTNTPTATSTDTPTNTPLPTDTSTAIPTNTPTDTPTDTPTATPTNTPTDTPTNTPTATPTDTPTATPTATPTNTPTPASAQFGDRVWIESDDDGLASTGVITPITGLVITATAGTNVYTATTNSQGYYSFTVPPGSYVVAYGSVPVSYGALRPSNGALGSGTLNGNAGSYLESGDPDINHPQNTQVTVAGGEANWQVDFAFAAPRADLNLRKTVDKVRVVQGDPLIYTLVLTNHGPDPATNIQVMDRLPATVNWVSDSGAGVYNHITGLWTVSSLAANASVTLTITVQIK